MLLFEGLKTTSKSQINTCSVRSRDMKPTPSLTRDCHKLTLILPTDIDLIAPFLNFTVTSLKHFQPPTRNPTDAPKIRLKIQANNPKANMNRSHNVIESSKNPKRKLTGEASILWNQGIATTLSEENKKSDQISVFPFFVSFFNRAREIQREETQARSYRTETSL
ncbi:hypothetical protein AAHE18_11G107000 [Arachis hypogaea]